MGIWINKVKEYWEARAKEQGELTVGFSNSPEEIQNENYQVRQDFLSQFIDKDLVVLDFGCGIGRHCNLFSTNRYLGVDVTEDLIKFAKQRQPNYTFLKLEDPHLDFDFSYNYDAIFTATVLQHNSDEGVRRILESFRNVKASGFTLYLYENTSDNSDASHIKFRRPDEYLELVEEVFGKCIDHEVLKHTVHNEEHSLIIIDY
jgi:SAM-dependent methyltransferase